MRPRAAGGLEPDDAEQRELIELWHLSRVGIEPRELDTIPRSSRISWVVVEFCKAHPGTASKWVYVWCERYLGVLVDPDPIPEPVGGWPDGPTNATFVPKRKRSSRSKKRAK